MFDPVALMSSLMVSQNPFSNVGVIESFLSVDCEDRARARETAWIVEGDVPRRNNDRNRESRRPSIAPGSSAAVGSTSTHERPTYFRPTSESRCCAGNALMNSSDTAFRLGSLNSLPMAARVSGGMSLQSVISELKLNEKPSRRGRSCSVRGRVLDERIHPPESPPFQALLAHPPPPPPPPNPPPRRLPPPPPRLPNSSSASSPTRIRRTCNPRCGLARRRRWNLS
ncbi:hypothetical protein CVT25_007640 [Psilocybe cyanescens]|uniref:Uncharacterized protein n=1 Tax=Psilocybe cyanescens TaxID=93625 RepID=A0A409X186_PSICY|nr:hypothetical protein CVT25_007640 [Psilocybe cyanescens]